MWENVILILMKKLLDISFAPMLLFMSFNEIKLDFSRLL